MDCVSVTSATQMIEGPTCLAASQTHLQKKTSWSYITYLGNLHFSVRGSGHWFNGRNIFIYSKRCGVYNRGTIHGTLLMDVSASCLICASVHVINQALIMLETYQLDMTPV